MVAKSMLRKEIGQRLRHAREKAGYASAEYFCLKNQLRIRLYMAYEKGDVAIKISKVVRYCRLLNVSLTWLMLG